MTAAICTAASLSVFSAGCNPPTSAGGTGSSATKGAPRVKTVLVEKQDLIEKIEMPGTVEGYETADLYSKVGGYLQRIHVNIGDAFPIDQELARLRIPEMEKQLQQKQALIDQADADVEQADAAVDQAVADEASAKAAYEESQAEREEKSAEVSFRETERERIRELVASRSARKDLFDQADFQLKSARASLKTVHARIRTAKAKWNAAIANTAKARADFKSAEARVEVAKADYAYADTMRKYASIRAPFKGQVTQRWVDAGAFIQPAEGNSAAKPLLQVARTDVVRILLDIPMAEVRLLDKADLARDLEGDRVVLDRINVLPGESFPGNVTRFSAGLHKNSRMMRVEIDLKNPDQLLRPGYYGYVTIYLEEFPQTPVVPSSALLSDGDERYVFVVRDGKAHKQIVTTNYQDGTIVGIATGLKGGEQVIRAGGGQVADGDVVETEAR